jgi:hypothetical protein
VLRGSLCEWAKCWLGARFRRSCPFEIRKYGQTQPVERYYDRESDQSSFFWVRGTCILVQTMHLSSFGPLQQVVHGSWAIYGVFVGAFFGLINLYLFVLDSPLAD